MLRRIFLTLWAGAVLLWAGKFVVTQPGEIITAPRASVAATPLLFAFAISQGGFDTEITVSNTSQDTLGSTPQGGSSTFSFYGFGAVPVSQTSSVISAGKQLVFKLSQGGGGIAAAPNFQGYVMASCSFPLARRNRKGVCTWRPRDSF
jgi:hypothetical protein